MLRFKFSQNIACKEITEISFISSRGIFQSKLLEGIPSIRNKMYLQNIQQDLC